MRVRVRGPNGVATISLEDTATVKALKDAITEKTSLPTFDLKLGYPPKPLDLEQYDAGLAVSDTGLSLNGEQLIVTAKDIQSKLAHPLHDTTPSSQTVPSLPGSSTSAAPAGLKEPANPLSLSRKPQDLAADPPEVYVDQLGSFVVLRVMPDDNSCLFRAVGSALLGSGLDGMTELRAIVAAGIQANPSLYNAAVLGRPPDDYCRWIQTPSSWGGAIELGILAQHFAVEIASVNVQDGRVDRFNEGTGAASRCILVYSGIHYDTLALSPYPNAPPDFDQKVFPIEDEAVLDAARRLADLLRQRHYYTDTAGFGVRCARCGWQGTGEKAAVSHAATTGHTDFGEA